MNSIYCELLQEIIICDRVREYISRFYNSLMVLYSLLVVYSIKADNKCFEIFN